MSYSRFSFNGMDLDEYLSSLGVGNSSSRSNNGGYSSVSISNFSSMGGNVHIGSMRVSGGNAKCVGMMTADGEYQVTVGGDYYDSIVRNRRNGEIEVTQEGLKTCYKGTKYDFVNGKLCIDGIEISENDNRITRDERKKVVKEDPKLANAPADQKDPAPRVSSNALIQNALNQAPVAAPEQKLSAEEAFMKDCSQFVKEYLNGFKDKKSNSAIVEEMKLTAEEMKLLEKFCDPMTHEIMNKPVELYEHFYDLNTVIKFENNEDPYTRLKFKPDHVQDGRSLVTEFEDTIKKIEANRKAAAQKNEVNEVRAPGGPRF